MLRSPDCVAFLKAMYGNEPAQWSEDLTGMSRLRVITNYLTRMRYCTAEGILDLESKGTSPTPGDQSLRNVSAWFSHPGRKTAKDRILFGHWASIEGHTDNPNAIALDTGCVWGGSLSLYELESGQWTRCACRDGKCHDKPITTRAMTALHRACTLSRWNIYLVGGAVRDALLDYPVAERDWVVVGARPEDLLTQGYQQVGKDFPVFPAPADQRGIRPGAHRAQTGHGYTGFAVDCDPSVTLEEDLLRRDLTINAMARDMAATSSIPTVASGPGNRVLRHVSEAFVEDPLRVLRTARFAARYAHLRFYSCS